MIYGYCRKSRPSQHIERQIDNIKSAYPSAVIRQESFTGTKIQGRRVFEKLLRDVKSGDTIVFDSVSRMSRNAEEGMETYTELYRRGVELIFLKEPHINTSVYRQALDNQISMTGTMLDSILRGINEYMINLAQQQVKIAFDQAQKEVDDLHQRTSEGMCKARERGARIGTERGRTLITKKSIAAKEQIKKHCKTFGGSLSDGQCMKMVGISRNTYYKYKSEIKQEMLAEET